MRRNTWPLTLNNAGAWLTRAEEMVCRGRELTRAALLEKARLLHSPTLRERLAQGTGDPFIAGLLAASSPEEMADYLAQTIGAADDTRAAAAIEALARYLKKLRVRRLRLADFSPGKRTIERRDVDAVVAEFRRFLLDGLTAGEDELPVVELE